MPKTKKASKTRANVTSPAHTQPSFFDKFFSFLQKNWQVLLYTLSGALLRFWNFQNSLYFIYDQGRDAIVWQKLAGGDLVLTGPTSGLSGFFLGPLWYYIGFPGYLLAQGNPYGICLWFIFLSCFALPGFWWLSHQLFPRQKFWAVVCAVLLAIVPGSINSSITIWNPLISVPLMVATLFFFSKSRESGKYLAAGFLTLALTLQSEFAYAIFFIVPFFFLIPWFRENRQTKKDFLAVIGVVLITGIPQVLFDLRHQFLMTRSLFSSLLDSSKSIPWTQLFAQRPTQLWEISRELFLGPGPKPLNIQVLIGFFMIIGLIGVATTLGKKERFFTHLSFADKYFVQLIGLFACIPYPFYLIWRGNYGYFFNYYLTPHYVFLIPVFVLGMKLVWKVFSSHIAGKTASGLLIALTLFSLGFSSWSHWYSSVYAPQNNAGLKKMLTAVETYYQWQQQDPSSPAVIRIFTPNIYTEHYDYLFHWYGETHGLQVPRTVKNDTDQKWFVLIEKWGDQTSPIFDKWNKETNANGEVLQREKIGILTLEKWQNKQP